MILHIWIFYFNLSRLLKYVLKKMIKLVTVLHFIVFITISLNFWNMKQKQHNRCLCVVTNNYCEIFCPEKLAKLLQLCLTLCNPMDCRPPAVHGILQAKTLEWVASEFPFSRGIFQTQKSNPHLLRLLHWQAGSLPLAPPGKPRVSSQTLDVAP